MPAHPADSALYARLFGDVETARLFSDSAEMRAMMLVEGALAQVQGGLGLIPRDAADFLHRAAQEVMIDPSALAEGVAQNAVPVPALIAAFRKESNAPDFAQYLHWGATSQDIMDTALALRLRPALVLWQGRLTALAQALAHLAETHADLPIAARSYGQVATPTSFGAVVAGWGWPLLGHLGALKAQRGGLLRVQLAGASGTLSAMGGQGPAVRAGLASALGLADPGHSFHSDRSHIASFAAWMAGLLGSLGKMGEDLILLTQSGIGEVAIAGAGGSSTMPQKQNPVGPSVLVALARHGAALAHSLQGAALHKQQRDGAAWMTEWLALPQLCIATGRALALSADVAARISPQPDAMQRGLGAGQGTIYAEAAVFALAEILPRPAAQAAVTALCGRAEAEAVALQDLLTAAYPQINWQSRLMRGALGEAPAEARAFAAAARALPNP